MNKPSQTTNRTPKSYTPELKRFLENYRLWIFAHGFGTAMVDDLLAKLPQKNGDDNAV